MKPAHKTLTREVEIAAYVHRTRMRMLAALRDGPATLTMIAERLGVHPANLTRHIRILERGGLVSLVEKRDTGRNLEKWYGAAAPSFDVAPDAKALRSPHKIALAFVRSDVSAALARLPNRDPGAVKALVVEAKLTPEQVRVMADEISALAQRFESGADPGRGTLHHLALALYPVDEEIPTPRIRLTKSRPNRTGK
jgi:DNA-binding transcriptional ArsR family regulator